jgi:hypothetical protein
LNVEQFRTQGRGFGEIEKTQANEIITIIKEMEPHYNRYRKAPPPKRNRNKSMEVLSGEGGYAGSLRCC